MTITLHPLADIAERMPADLVAPERWLTKQIRSGRIRARKIGRRWYMTDADVAFTLEVFANIPALPAAPAPSTSVSAVAPAPSTQPSAASMRRRLKVAK